MSASSRANQPLRKVIKVEYHGGMMGAFGHYATLECGHIVSEHTNQKRMRCFECWEQSKLLINVFKD